MAPVVERRARPNVPGILAAEVGCSQCSETGRAKDCARSDARSRRLLPGSRRPDPVPTTSSACSGQGSRRRKAGGGEDKGRAGQVTAAPAAAAGLRHAAASGALPRCWSARGSPVALGPRRREMAQHVLPRQLQPSLLLEDRGVALLDLAARHSRLGVFLLVGYRLAFEPSCHGEPPSRFRRQRHAAQSIGRSTTASQAPATALWTRPVQLSVRPMSMKMGHGNL